MVKPNSRATFRRSASFASIARGGLASATGVPAKTAQHSSSPCRDMYRMPEYIPSPSSSSRAYVHSAIARRLRCFHVHERGRILEREREDAASVPPGHGDAPRPHVVVVGVLIDGGGRGTWTEPREGFAVAALEQRAAVEPWPRWCPCEPLRRRAAARHPREQPGMPYLSKSQIGQE